LASEKEKEKGKSKALDLFRLFVRGIQLKHLQGQDVVVIYEPGGNTKNTKEKRQKRERKEKKKK